MNYKAIAVDLDGTLLNSQALISDRTRDALINLQKQGVRLILASGRPTPGMERYAKHLELDKYGGYVVSYNGTTAMNYATKEVLFNQALPHEDAVAVLDHLKQFNVYPMIVHQDNMYVNDVFDSIIRFQDQDVNIVEYESRGCNLRLNERKDLSASLDFPINKILIGATPEYLESVYKEMEKPFLGRLTTSFSAPFYFEFTDNGVDKAHALKHVLEELSLEPKDLIAFGDSGNDVTMLQYAGMGVAMGNAIPAVKEVADTITVTNDEDGIIEALNLYL